MLTAYKNGAEQSAEIVTRYANGAEMEADAVYKYVDGAEQKVWSRAKDLQWLFTNWNRDYDASYRDDDTHLSMVVYAGTVEYLYILTLIDEPYVNPTIEFDWYGGAHTGSTYTQAGMIYAVGIKSNGSEVVQACGTMGSASNETGDTESVTLSGTFDQVGIKVTFVNSSSYGDEYIAWADVYNIVIDGVPCRIS